MKKRIIIISVISLVLLISLIIQMFYKMEDTEIGLVYRNGRYVKTVQPGIHVKFPLGIDRIAKVSVGNMEILQVDDNDMLFMRTVTADGFMVDLNYSVSYSVRDAGKWVQQTDNPVFILLAAVNSLIVEYCSQKDVSNLISSRYETESRIYEIIAADTLIAETGIHVNEFKLIDILYWDIDIRNALFERNQGILAAEREVEQLQQKYETAYNENRLTERASRRIAEEGFPW